MTYVQSLDHYITALPLSPFVNEADIDDERRFVLDENRFFKAIRAASDHWPMLDWPVWSKRQPQPPIEFNDPPPLFIGAPSDDFIAACHRDLLPMLERLARRAA